VTPTVRPRLDPAVAWARLLVRDATGDLATGSLALVACSGGADSVALLCAARFEADRAGWRCGAVVVDHGLQDDSAEVAAQAAATARGLGADPVVQLSAEVAGPGGPEAAARRARYQALHDAAERAGAVAVLLGHTLDDQAESVLLGLARGSGTRSLAGMAARDGLWRRPFLDLRRAETEAVCRASGVQWWLDPHNTDPAYTRSRVRSRLLPALEAELGPGVAEALARTARLARDDADLLDALAVDLAARARTPDGWDVPALAAAPAALRSRVLRGAALAAGCPATDLTAGHVEALAALLRPRQAGKGVDLPGQVRARRSSGTLHLDRGAVTG